MHLLNFALTLAKRSKCDTAIYIYASERSRYVLSENVIVYYTMIWCFEDISVWKRRVLLNFCWVIIVFDILIANTSCTVAQTPLSHTIFWKTVIRTFRSIHVNCFNKLRFLSEVIFYIFYRRKYIFLDNLRTVTHFLIYFFCSVCNIHFL